MFIPLGDFRNLSDEKGLTQKEHEKAKQKIINELKHIDYPAVIKDLEEKYNNCSKKDKRNYLAVLEIAKKQYGMI